MEYLRHVPPDYTNPRSRIMLVAASIIVLSMHGASAQVMPADIFVGETLYYTIDFWLLRGSAAGELCFTKTPQGYTALFEAETKGFLRRIAGHRKEIMESTMEYDQQRQRLRPLVFTETFIHNNRQYKRALAFDYKNGTFTCTRTYPGATPKTIRAALPENEFEDLLTLYYNFRLGCYGDLRDSGSLKAQVVMKEQPSIINIEFPAAGTKERARGFTSVLTMDRNLTHARSKRVLTKISPSSVLERALVIDAYFFGDLEVTLTGKTCH